ncbi:MAG: NAD(P)/FAD-dependent oxidoreductase [Dehalococcoidia bacterium]|nr:NAD(P)/FAD-dependent oxidoreductase [Dehalococcoidia bacterium]
MSATAQGNGAGGASSASFDAVIVGAGFAGMYQLHRLRGAGFSARVIEAGDGVGGTWYWNRYPGARCDVESLDYQYSFSDDLQREWDWTERYATQPEILKYANHVADRFDLRRDIQFETRVNTATFDEQANRWDITTSRGDRYSARFFIMATGCLSAARVPDFKGVETFKGDTYHTGQWPHEGVDFTGKRVGIIGTGSSAIQSIPIIAQQAAHLTVFQRTPNYSLPANNESLTSEKISVYKQNFAEIKQTARETASGIITNPRDISVLQAGPDERRTLFEEGWHEGGFHLLEKFNDLVATNAANETVAEFVRQKIREVVKDPQTAELLCPKDYPLGTKRICIDTNYFETFNRDNVTLVNIKDAPIEEITPTGVRNKDGSWEFDAIVFATGFDAMTGAILGVDIKGRGGASLREKWAAGPRTYLGLSVADYPNMFLITGPGSPSVLSNMIVSIEQHVDWITGCMDYMRTNNLATIEATKPAEDAWVDHVNELANMTLYPQANSWYLGANVPGKPRVFMPYVGGVGAYRIKCDEVAAKGYEGFTLGAAERELATV